MTTNTRIDSARTRGRRGLAAGALAATLLAAAGCAGGPSTVPTSPTGSAPAAAGQQVVLRFDDGRSVAASLADTAAGRDFAARLPLTLNPSDAMGQAKIAPLTAPLPGTGRVTDPDAGGIYWAPAEQMIAFYYDDLGQQVPSPGLVPLGTVPNPDDLERAQGPILIELARPAQP